jgi:hypothetical protein
MELSKIRKSYQAIILEDATLNWMEFETKARKIMKDLVTPIID